MASAQKNLHILIAGGGPAGSSLGIRLARLGHDVTLVEREKFPRHKLCGEFISPECIDHFEELGIRETMLASGGAAIAETVFYEQGGRGVSIPSEWLGRNVTALSLSRARMDDVLLRRAQSEGVQVVEATSVNGVEIEGGRVAAIKIRDENGELSELTADVFIDATGRQRVLARLIEKASGSGGTDTPQEKLIGFKIHLHNAAIPADRCEIYSFPGGYAGLSPIENGLANLCMMVKASTAAKIKTDRLIVDLVSRNRRARESLESSVPASEWLAVAVDRFGTREFRPAGNLFAAGDSAAFIDPFTGSGMLMALEGSKALAAAFTVANDLNAIHLEYVRTVAKLFDRRLRISAALRHAAFSPKLAAATVRLLSMSSTLRRAVAHSTRGTADKMSDPCQ